MGRNPYCFYHGEYKPLRVKTKEMKNYLKIDGKKIELSEETARNLKEQFEVKEDILVPDCVKIEDTGLNGDGLGILFNNNKQSLCWSEGYNGIYRVIIAGLSGDKLAASVQCKLIPCKRGDLKPGDTAFRTDKLHSDFSELERYCKILSTKEEAHIYYESIIAGNLSWTYWYKVVPV